MTFGDPRLPDRFWAKCIPEPNSGCWLWLASCNEKGYGLFGWNGKHIKSHRLTYLVLVGDVPPGLELDHLCRTRCCVNPLHLEAVTHQENVRRGSNPNRERATCHKGHAYTEQNTRTSSSDGSRVCRECMRLYMTAHRSRRRAA